MKKPKIEDLIAQGPGAGAADEGSEFDLGDILAQIMARKWLIGFATLIGLGVGFIQGQLPPDEFEATSVVQIERRSSGVALPAELVGSLLGNPTAQSSLTTEIHIIESRLILGPVVDELAFDIRVVPARAPVIGDALARRTIPFVDAFIPAEYQRVGEGLVLDSFTIPEDLIGRRYALESLGDGTFKLNSPDGQLFEGAVGEPLELPAGAVLTVAELNAPAGRKYDLYREPLRNSVGRLRSGLRVRERGSTGIVDFRYSSGDRDEAIMAVNAVVASYQEQNLRRRSAEIDQSIEFIEEQLPEIRAEVREANAALATYREGQQSAELSLGTQELLSRVVEIQSALEELDFQEEQLAQTLTPNHPDYRTLLAERARFEERLAEIRLSLRDVPEAEQELARLTERVEAAGELEKQLTARVEQLRVLRASTVGNIRVLEPAEVARFVGPDRRSPFLTAGGIGFVLAVLLTFGINFLRRGIEDARQIESMGLSLIGSVSKVPALQGKRSGNAEYALAISQPDDMAVEAIRGLRTGLQFTLAAAQSETLMITSCAPSDGKSFISLNLGIVTAQTGKAVLLIDADMRRGELSKNFGLSRKDPGLSDYLAGSKPLSDCVIVDPKTGIEFIGTGRFPPNPAELLASKKLDELLEVAAEHYDLVIVDAPPVLAVTDPGIIGQKTGISILIVRHLVTTQSEIMSAQKTLSTSGVRISGVVINHYDQSRSRYGTYGSRYTYQYGGYKYKYKS